MTVANTVTNRRFTVAQIRACATVVKSCAARTYAMTVTNRRAFPKTFARVSENRRPARYGDTHALRMCIFKSNAMPTVATVATVRDGNVPPVRAHPRAMASEAPTIVQRFLPGDRRQQTPAGTVAVLGTVCFACPNFD
ncbi:MAG: hypothetical protein SGJ19_24445 [Planctomycetia bacterium]|nr:hypothetical protein [Planctomycetia bacterium]